MAETQIITAPKISSIERTADRLSTFAADCLNWDETNRIYSP